MTREDGRIIIGAICSNPDGSTFDQVTQLVQAFVQQYGPLPDDVAAAFRKMAKEVKVEP